jgi:hypothetical protein
LFAFQLRGATPRHGLTYRNGYATRSPRGPQAGSIATIAEGICALLHPVRGGTAAASGGLRIADGHQNRKAWREFRGAPGDALFRKEKRAISAHS